MVAFVRGLLTPMLSAKVNFVNAMHLAKERGIKVIESKTEQAEEYTGLITATIKTDQGPVVVAGTIFGHNYPRLVRINNVTVDLTLSGNMLVLKNIDRPGIIGQIGTVLGKNNINIAGMQVGRKDVGGEATTIINIDAVANADVSKQIASLSGVTDVRSIAL
jgi:D-3-phosphoglycerate dehydrogenase